MEERGQTRVPGRHVGRALVGGAEVTKRRKCTTRRRALAGNDAAIALYQRCGEIIERLLILQCTLVLLHSWATVTGLFSSQRSTTRRPRFGFYRSDFGGKWPSVAARKGSAIVHDASGVAVGYALYLHFHPKPGMLAVITLSMRSQGGIN